MCEAGCELGRHNPAKALEGGSTCLSVEVHKHPVGQAESYPADSSDPAMDWLGDFGNQVPSTWRVAVANKTKNRIDTKPKINPKNEKWMGTKLACWPYKTPCMSPVRWLQQEQKYLGALLHLFGREKADTLLKKKSFWRGFSCFHTLQGEVISLMCLSGNYVLWPKQESYLNSACFIVWCENSSCAEKPDIGSGYGHMWLLFVREIHLSFIQICGSVRFCVE